MANRIVRARINPDESRFQVRGAPTIFYVVPWALAHDDGDVLIDLSAGWTERESGTSNVSVFRYNDGYLVRSLPDRISPASANRAYGPVYTED